MIRQRNTDTDLPQLQSISLLPDRADRELAHLTLTADGLWLRPSFELLREGETPYEFYVLLNGEVEVTFAGGLVSTAGPGALIGAEAVQSGTPSGVTVTPTGPARVLAFGYRAAEVLLQRVGSVPIAEAV